TTPPHTLSLHDALPILLPAEHHGSGAPRHRERRDTDDDPQCRSEEVVDRCEEIHVACLLAVVEALCRWECLVQNRCDLARAEPRSEEHTSELQSRENLV